MGIIKFGKSKKLVMIIILGMLFIFNLKNKNEGYVGIRDFFDNNYYF